MAAELTEQQERFCRAYVANGGNGAAAAVAAGYSKAGAAVQAHRLLKNTAIELRVAQLKLEVATGGVTLLRPPSGGAAGAPPSPPIDGDVYGPGAALPPPGGTMSPEEELTRGYIVNGLMEVVEIGLGRRTVLERVMLKGTIVGHDGSMKQEVRVEELQVTDRNLSAAVNALKALSDQIEIIKAAGGKVPENANTFLAEQDAEKMGRLGAHIPGRKAATA